MITIVGVRFKRVGKIYYFDPQGEDLPLETRVIVETSRGIECGEVVITNREVDEENLVLPLKKVIRVATPEDLDAVVRNRTLEGQAFKVCQERIRAREMKMKLVGVESTFDRGRLLFYFTADGRIDFRELVKDLAAVFHTRIELRQIGVRDSAKLSGGLGVCGCPLCCATFLEEFEPVSINMAKDQGLSLNPSKISGACGRLMCCLKYEDDAYQQMLSVSPPVDSLVETPKGKGTVIELSLLKGCCKVRMLSNPDSLETFPCQRCRVLRRGGENAESIELYPEEQS